MIKVALIGFGNVAHHLISALLKSNEIQIVSVFARNKARAEAFESNVNFVCDINEIGNADLYIIAVSDDAVATVSEQLPFAGRLVVHTSGSVAITGLSDKNRRGVFYPLQTFSKSKTVDFTTVPICIEAENPTDLDVLQKVAAQLSATVYALNSDQRKALHLAAVFASNFTNHMYRLSEKICQENAMPFDLLKPLIKETANKIQTMSPRDAQTGPARRNDVETINQHLKSISDKNLNHIYKVLTQSIRHEQEL